MGKLKKSKYQTLRFPLFSEKECLL
jgi:hypothetical protein